MSVNRKYLQRGATNHYVSLINIDSENFDAADIWDKNNYSRVDFDLRLASTNTRP